MYENLSLSIGGGIIGDAQLSKQDNCAVLAIGLGGTGIDCLRELKKKVYNRLEPDNPNDSVHRYEHIRFLAVDADALGMKRMPKGDMGELDEDTEFFDISYAGVLSELFKKDRKRFAEDPVYREWLQFGTIKNGAVNTGACGVRQIGRFLLMRRASQFVAQVRDLIDTAKQNLGRNPSVCVHIFSGMGGGTGSGTFLDVCYLIREILTNLQGGVTHRIMGYFFLPDVNLAKGLDLSAQLYIKVNGYAAMQELDYCMGFGQNGDGWDQSYPGIGNVCSTSQPVDLCHLVAASTTEGAAMDNAYEYAMNVVSDYVMDFLTKPQAVGPIVFGLASHFSNIEQHKAGVKDSTVTKAGAFYDYLVIGAASAMIPSKEIMTYLASGFLQRLESMRNKVPTDEEVDTFLNSIGFTYDALEQRVRSGVDFSFPKRKDKPEDVKQNEKLVVDYFQQMYSAASGKLMSNFNNLIAEPATDGVQSDGKGGSVMAEILAGICDVMVDPDRGPWYAAALVRGAKARTLLAEAGGIKERAKNRRDHENHQQVSHLNKGQQKAQQKFRTSNFLTLGATCDKFVNETRNLYLSQTEEKAYQTLMNLMDSVSVQLADLADTFTDPFELAVTNLLDTFNTNWMYLQAIKPNAYSFDKPIVNVRTLAPVLDAALNGLTIKIAAKELLNTLLDEGVNVWGPGGDDVRLSNVVSNFFRRTFGPWSNKTLTSYLQVVYKQTDVLKLANSVKNGFLSQLDADSDPLFVPDVRYTVPTDSEVIYVTVPQNVPAVVGAANALAAGKNGFTVRQTFVSDRVSFLRLMAGVAMWGYGNTAIYETAYYAAAATHGRHLYEKAEYVADVLNDKPVTTSRDWGLLPSPIPLSVADPGGRAKKFGKTYDEALSAGVIVRREKSGYYIRTLDNNFMQNVRNVYDKAKNGSVVARNAALVSLKTMDANRVYDLTEIFFSDMLRAGNAGAERTICVDLLAKAPKLMEVVEAELRKCKEIAERIVAFTPDVDQIDFFNALLTGVIKFCYPTVVYIDVQDGDEYTLSNRSMDFGDVPLYQAFVSYKGLDSSLRSEIKNRATDILKMNNLPEDAADAWRGVQSELDQKKSLINIANNNFPNEADKIKDFIRSLSDKVSAFKASYRISN